jgi:hypothetical protein
MSNQFYDREDLDEEEKKLFDVMVLEEMEKLENQFKNSVAEDEQAVSKLHMDSNSQPECKDESSYSRDIPLNLVHITEKQRNDYSDSSSPVNGKNRSGQCEPVRRAPRISIGNINYSVHDVEDNEKSLPKKRQIVQEYSTLLETGTKAPTEVSGSVSQRFQHPEYTIEARYGYRDNVYCQLV